MHGVTVENNLLGSLPNIITIIIYTNINIIMNAMESVWLKKIICEYHVLSPCMALTILCLLTDTPTDTLQALLRTFFFTIVASS